MSQTHGKKRKDQITGGIHNTRLTDNKYSWTRKME